MCPDIIIPSDYELETISNGVPHTTRIRLSSVRISSMGVYVIFNYMSPKSITEMPIDHFVSWFSSFRVVSHLIV